MLRTKALYIKDKYSMKGNQFYHEKCKKNNNLWKLKSAFLIFRFQGSSFLFFMKIYLLGGQTNSISWVFCKNQACNFIKEGTLAQVFSCEFCKIMCPSNHLPNFKIQNGALRQD